MHTITKFINAKNVTTVQNPKLQLLSISSSYGFPIPTDKEIDCSWIKMFSSVSA